MCGRIRCPILRLSVAAVGSLFLATGSVRAHRLEADYRVLTGQRIQIESWFDLTGESPRGAAVQVFRADGRLLAEGTLDDRGLFLFSFEEPAPLRVIVAAGGGHRKELEIPADALNRVGEKDSSGPTASGSAEEPGPFADRGSRVTVKDVVVGVAFLLAVAAFALSIRNTRALKRLRDRD